MKIILENSVNIEISSLADISKIIPPKYNGKPLNYGQGEGQFEIENNVWGIYVNESRDYYLQFEEGNLFWVEWQQMLNNIVGHIEIMFNTSLNISIEGSF